MSQPAHAIETLNGRYYRDPAGGPDLVSVTNVLATAVAKPALTWWAAGKAAAWAADHRMEGARRAVTDRAALVKEMQRQHDEASETAMDLGTRVHTACEHRLLGSPVPADTEVRPYLRQFDKWLTAWGWSPVTVRTEW